MFWKDTVVLYDQLVLRKETLSAFACLLTEKKCVVTFSKGRGPQDKGELNCLVDRWEWDGQAKKTAKSPPRHAPASNLLRDFYK
jgi:hypothetical protein